MKYATMLLVFLIWLAACAQNQPVAALQNEPAAQDAQGNPQSDQPREKSESDQPKPKIMVELTHEETGETKWVEGEVVVTPGEEYIMLPKKPELDVSFDRVLLSDENSQRVKVELDKVTLVEYWSTDALKKNKFWSQMRELERQYASNEDIQILSIHYDTVLSGKDQIEAAKNHLKQYTPPGSLYYDFLDSFRDQIPVPGPVSYYLIDHRRQMTHFGRGDVAATQKLFDAIENALIFQRADRQNGKVQLLTPLEDTPAEN